MLSILRTVDCGREANVDSGSNSQNFYRPIGISPCKIAKIEYNKISQKKERCIFMIGATATATEMQNNFGRYLGIVMGGNEVIVTKNGREVGRFIPRDTAVSYLTDSLAGILKSDTGLDQAREERLKERYEIAD